MPTREKVERSSPEFVGIDPKPEPIPRAEDPTRSVVDTAARASVRDAVGGRAYLNAAGRRRSAARRSPEFLRVRDTPPPRAEQLSPVRQLRNPGTPQLADSTTARQPSSEVKYIVSNQRLREFAELAKEQGWDLKAVLHSAGILGPSHRPRCLGVTRNGLTYFMQEMWRLTNDELLGLGSHPIPRGTFRLLAFALSSAPDLGTAVTRFQQCKQAVPGLPAISVNTVGNVATLTIESRDSTRPNDLYTDSLVAVAHRSINWALGRPLPLFEVHLPRPRPPAVDEYHFIFGSPVQFSSPTAALVFDNRALAEPISPTHDELEEFLQSAPHGLLTQYQPCTSHSERVRQIMKGCLGRAWGSADDIAAHVGMSRQTLHRRLREENTSILDIKQEVLREAAVESLMKGDETIAALSRRLGFSEPSAFTRAFRRWTGIPPSTYRMTSAARLPAGL